MSKRRGNKPLTAEQRRRRRERRAQFMTIFVNGKQKRVRRPPQIDDMDAEMFIARNADPIWLLEHGYYELLDRDERE